MNEMTDTEIKNIGMKCLTEALGSVGAERFIFLMNKDIADYTIWRRSVLDNMSDEEIVNMTRKYMEEHPLDEDFKRNLKKII